MRILFIIHDNGLGGIWAVTEKIAKKFLTENIDIKILILSGKLSTPNSNVVASGLSYAFYYIDPKIPVQGLLFEAIPAIRNTFKQYNPDIVISSHFWVNFLTVLTLSFTKKKIIVCDHGTPKYFTRFSSANRLTKITLEIRNFLCVQFYRFADKIVVVSEGTRSELISYFKLPKEKIIRIYNPVVTPDLLSKATLPVIHPWIQNRQSKIILAVGRLSAQKDYPTLIKAFYNLRQKMDCKLIILGDGPEKSALIKLVKDLELKNDVDMVGFVDNPYAYMSKVDVFVLSSVFEGFGLVVAEALACGCQVVATNCPSGPAEILENGKYGILVPIRDPSTLANALIEVLIGNKIIPREQLIKHSEEFSADKAIAQYKQLFST